MAIDPWALVGIMGTTLAGVIATLWKLLSSHFEEKDKRIKAFETRELKNLESQKARIHEEKQRDRDTNRKILELSVEVEGIRSSREGHTKGIIQMVDAVNKTLENSLSQRKHNNDQNNNNPP